MLLNLSNKIKRKFVTSVVLTSIALSTVVVLADAAHLFTGGYGKADTQSIKYVLYDGDQTYQNMMKAGANAWNGISTKVSLSNSVTDSKMNIFKGTTTTPRLLGRMYPYYKNWLGKELQDTSYTETWTRTEVYGYDNVMTTLKMNINQKQSNYSHEVGHALSMAHTNELPTSTNTVMRQGIQQIGPQLTDKGHLKLKWGN